ncbi:MAG: hypothetical protein KDK00_11750 [Rhodobacteraceae bacterium]|nr:hypothetical protein [Paracoccaceae bacterium]
MKLGGGNPARFSVRRVDGTKFLLKNFSLQDFQKNPDGLRIALESNHPDKGQAGKSPIVGADFAATTSCDAAMDSIVR